MNSAWLRPAVVAAAWWGVMLVATPAMATSDPPSKPELDPLPACTAFCDARYSMIESATPLLVAVSADLDSPSLTYTFTIEDYMTDVVLASEQFVAPPGEAVRWQVPAGVITGGTTYRWSVTVHDGSTTVTNDKYFSYHPPETLAERLGGAAAEAGFFVLFALPLVGGAVAVLGLVIIFWRRRLGLWMLLGGLGIGAAAVAAIFEILGNIGS